jgi:hypothetical protein
VTARTLAAAVLAALVGTALAQPTNPAGTNQPTGAPVPLAGKADPKADKTDIAKQLAARVSVQKYEGKFKDAVKMIAEAYDLPLVLTKRAAEWRNYNDDDTEITAADRPVALPRLNNVKVETLLALLCEQTQTKFLIYPDSIKIVPEWFADYESGVLVVKDNGGEGCDPPLLTHADLVRTKPLIKRGLVNASFKNKPLSEVIDEIVESTGANVALSPTLPPNVRSLPITAKFANTPVDAAVRTLCEMAECGVIEDANVLLVTTRERATAREKEELQKVKDRRQPQFIGGLGNIGGFAPQPDLAAEVAKLKEQNEQLKKQLDTLEKLLKK